MFGTTEAGPESLEEISALNLGLKTEAETVTSASGWPAKQVGFIRPTPIPHNTTPINAHYSNALLHTSHHTREPTCSTSKTLPRDSFYHVLDRHEGQAPSLDRPRAQGADGAESQLEVSIPARSRDGNVESLGVNQGLRARVQRKGNA